MPSCSAKRTVSHSATAPSQISVTRNIMRATECTSPIDSACVLVCSSIRVRSFKCPPINSPISMAEVIMPNPLS